MDAFLSGCFWQSNANDMYITIWTISICLPEQWIPKQMIRKHTNREVLLPPSWIRFESRKTCQSWWCFAKVAMHGGYHDHGIGFKAGSFSTEDQKVKSSSPSNWSYCSCKQNWLRTQRWDVMLHICTRALWYGHLDLLPYSGVETSRASSKLVTNPTSSKCLQIGVVYAKTSDHPSVFLYDLKVWKQRDCAKMRKVFNELEPLLIAIWRILHVTAGRHPTWVFCCWIIVIQFVSNQTESAITKCYGLTYRIGTKSNQRMPKTRNKEWDIHKVKHTACTSMVSWRPWVEPPHKRSQIEWHFRCGKELSSAPWLACKKWTFLGWMGTAQHIFMYQKG